MSEVRVSILAAGFCSCSEHLAMRGGARRTIRFPAMFALLEHPRLGAMLFDTGYSWRFFEETRTWPNRLYRLATPVTLREEDLAVNQLQARGIRPQDITRIWVSHFHGDHIGALGDFPQARFSYLPGAFEAVRRSSGLAALARAYLPGLIPGDFAERSDPVQAGQACRLPPEFAPFERGFDVLGDGSILAVELPGHAAGQMGLIVRGKGGETYFFAADAAWLGRGLREGRPPHALTDLFFEQPRVYRETQGQLRELQMRQPGLHLIPSHCAETLAAHQAGAG